MHEFGYVEGILDAVRRRADGRRVQRVVLQVGVRHRIVDEALAQAFTMAATGTEAEGAIIDLTQVRARLDCGACGDTAEVEDQLALCPACGSADVAVTGGDQLVLVSITLAADADGSRPGRGVV